jgi:hypothetical protein
MNIPERTLTGHSEEDDQLLREDAAGCVHREGKIGSSRRELDAWVRTLPQPRMMAIEATSFTGWIYDCLLPHPEKLNVAHRLMLRAIAAAKKKNDKVDAAKIADCLRCDFLLECYIAPTEIRDRRRVLRYRNLMVKTVWLFTRPLTLVDICCGTVQSCRIGGRRGISGCGMRWKLALSLRLC